MEPETKKRIALVMAGILVAYVAYRWFRSRRTLPADQAIQKLIDDGISAARDGDVGGIMDYVSSDFRGEVGAGEDVDRRGLKGYLFIMMRRTGGIGIEVVSQEVELFEDEATVTLVALMWRGGVRDALQGDATAREIELDIRREGRSWKVVASRHRFVNVDDFL